eukprot:1078994-Amphidinium_carterae.1
MLSAATASAFLIVCQLTAYLPALSVRDLHATQLRKERPSCQQLELDDAESCKPTSLGGTI